MNIELSDELWSKVVQSAEKLHFASAQQYVKHVIEREVGGAPGTDSIVDVIQKMQELGYLDYGLDI